MTQLNVDIAPIGNSAEMLQVGNSVELAVFDVFTKRYLLSQFQVGEENEEVRHGGSNA